MIIKKLDTQKLYICSCLKALHTLATTSAFSKSLHFCWDLNGSVFYFNAKDW